MRALRQVALVLCLILPSSSSAQEPTSGTPEAALAGFKTALEAGKLGEVAQLSAGEPGEMLRRLAGPQAKARAASDRLDKALKEKNVAAQNPFAAGLVPFADLQFDIVNITKEKDQTLARVKCGPRGKGVEESVLLRQEGGVWRIVPPAEVVRQLPAKGRLDRFIEGLDKLAVVLDELAVETEKGRIATKEHFTLRLIELSAREKLPELLR